MTLATSQAAGGTDPLVIAVSVLSTVLVVVVTAWLARKGEHAKWVREQRYKAYVAFMIDMSTLTALLETDVFITNLVKVKARAHDYTENASAAFEAVSLLGPRKVNAAGQQWVWAAKCYERSKSAEDRTALSRARWQFLIVAGEVLSSKNVTPEPLARIDAIPDSAASAASR